MTVDQELALRIFANNTAQNVLRNAQKGAITFEEAVYVLQSELLQIGFCPYDFCRSAGYFKEEVRETA